MKMVVSDSRPCKLRRGEMRRVPLDRAWRGIVGYHLCCPRCGFVTAVLNGEQDVAITESDDGKIVSFSHPARCVYCAVLIHLSQGEGRLEEDSNVRNVQYRRPS